MDENAAGSERERLADANRPVETIDAFIDAHLPRVTARLWSTCCWPESMAEGWKVGDFRYVIFSVEPEGASLYVQFWSEPGEDVVMEVCSGAWNPGAVEYVGRPERGKLERLGFAVDGRADNFGKEVTIASPADAERYAREVLTVLFDVFGYRGQWPFEVQREQGARWEMAATYESLTPEDFGKLAAEVGYDAAIVDADGTPIVAWSAGSHAGNTLLVARPGQADEPVRVNPAGASVDSLHQAPGLALGPGGDIYLADTESHTIRVIRKSTGRIETIVGDGAKGAGPDGDPLHCRLDRPHGVFVDREGNVYIGDSNNNKVRVFLLGDGVICGLAGLNPPDATYNVHELFKQLTQRDVPIGVCFPCMEQRGVPDTMLIEGARRSTMDDLTAWTEEAEKVLVF